MTHLVNVENDKWCNNYLAYLKKNKRKEFSELTVSYVEFSKHHNTCLICQKLPVMLGPSSQMYRCKISHIPQKSHHRTYWVGQDTLRSKFITTNYAESPNVSPQVMLDNSKCKKSLANVKAELLHRSFITVQSHKDPNEM